MHNPTALHCMACVTAGSTCRTAPEILMRQQQVRDESCTTLKLVQGTTCLIKHPFHHQQLQTGCAEQTHDPARYVPAICYLKPLELPNRTNCQDVSQGWSLQL